MFDNLVAVNSRQWCTISEEPRVAAYFLVNKKISEMNDQPAAERALEDDVLRVSAEFHQPGEGGKSPMLEVQIMSITGDVFPVQVSPDDTVRNRCQHQQDLNCLCIDQVAALEQQAKVAMHADGRVELFFENNPVLPGD